MASAVPKRPLKSHRKQSRAAPRYRQLESVNEWLTGCPADLGGYRELFSGPGRLATTVIVTLGHEPDVAELAY